MKKSFKIFIVFGVFIFGINYWFAKQFSICENTIVSESFLDEDFKLIVFDRNCGATTSLSTHVSLLEIEEKLYDTLKGNVLIIDKSEVMLTKNTSRNYLISYESGTEDFKKATSLLGYSFVYETH